MIINTNNNEEEDDNMKKQAFNPYLPSYEYIPDGEPHVFGERVYIYGSHDRFNGAEYCMNDYVVWSAPIDDLSDWKYEGVIYTKTQDPYNNGSHPNTTRNCENGIHYMYAPDVCQGPDGKYYLYYFFDNVSRVCVAVSDSPTGKFEFLGYVRDKDGSIVGERDGDFVQFDPAVLVDTDNRVYLYTGNAPAARQMKKIYTHNHSQVMELESDMLTVKKGPDLLLPDIDESVKEKVGFKGHEFFEASSIRKIGDIYYLVYSDVMGTNLCYATSKKPMEGFTYGGVIVSNGDVGLEGRTRKNPTAAIGNNHGGLCKINDKWYIFYHRQTNCHDHSRQGCAEEIVIKDDGCINQVEITSCGLNHGPLKGEGNYPSSIACALWNKKRANSFSFKMLKPFFPYITMDGVDRENGENEQYIANIKNGFSCGFKYFVFDGLSKIAVEIRGKCKGKLQVTTDKEFKSPPICEIKVDGTNLWKSFEGRAENINGKYEIYIRFIGKGSLQIKAINFIK